MAPVRMAGSRTAFPRPGAWTTLSDGRVGVIFKINTIHIPDPTSSTDTIAVKEADVHLVNSKRETAESVKLPADQLRMATYDEIKPYLDADASMFAIAVMGYALNDTDLQSLTAVQRMRLGKSLNDADKAQALVEESQENLNALKRQRVAQHPDAIALEAQIETERQAFIASAESRRQALFDKLSQSPTS